VSNSEQPGNQAHERESIREKTESEARLENPYDHQEWQESTCEQKHEGYYNEPHGSRDSHQR